MIFRFPWISMRTALCITVMHSTRSFLFANIITLQNLFGTGSFKTLYFSRSKTTYTILIHNNFTFWMISFMTTFWAFMAAWQNFFTRHPTSWNWILTFLSKVFIPSQHFYRIRSTWTGFLQLRSLLTWSTSSWMTFILTCVVTAVKNFTTDILTWIGNFYAVNNVLVFSTETSNQMFLFAW